MEKVANELSVPMKTGYGNRVKENDGSVWNDILLSAIDSDLVCNICLEIFIKVLSIII